MKNVLLNEIWFLEQMEGEEIERFRDMLIKQKWYEILQMLQRIIVTRRNSHLDKVFKLLTSRKLFHIMLKDNISIDVISKMIEVGGEALVREKDDMGCNSLHITCKYNASLDLVSKLIEVGGEALVREKGYEGCNSLHVALLHNVSIDIVSKLVKVGGEALVREKDAYGQNSLHLTCKRAFCRWLHNDENYTLLEDTLLSILTQHGGAEILTQTSKFGKTPLQIFIASSDDDDDDHDDDDDDDDGWIIQAAKERYWDQMRNNVVTLINKGIELKVGGEYGIGGLFTSTSSQEVQDQIYHNWDNIVLPAVIALPHDQHLPILQALIINKAPPGIIKSTINYFAESVNTADSFGKYPIDIASHHGLAWDGGMKEVVERSDTSLLEREDVSTGLLPFMVAALGGKKNNHNIGAVFHLIKACPKLVQQFDTNRGEECRFDGDGGKYEESKKVKLFHPFDAEGKRKRQKIRTHHTLKMPSSQREKRFQITSSSSSFSDGDGKDFHHVKSRKLAKPPPRKPNVASVASISASNSQTNHDCDHDHGNDDDNKHQRATKQEAEIDSQPKRKRIKWSEEEADAVRKGFRKYGNQWVAIKEEYSDILTCRTNVNIKDKVRTMMKRNEL